MTLELSNVANLPITIYHGMKIGQLSFVQLSEPAAAPYGSDGLGSKYQGQQGPTPSRYWKNFRVILVTGGTGFVGPKVVHALRAEDRDVRALVREPEQGRHAAGTGAASSSQGDVTDAASLRRAAAGLRRRRPPGLDHHRQRRTTSSA